MENIMKRNSFLLLFFICILPVSGWAQTGPDLNDWLRNAHGKVSLKMVRHNYDYYNRGTVWDPGIVSRTLPESLFYTAKPAYFGTAPWPPIGPDVTGLVNDIPAKARWNTFASSGNVGDLF